MAIDVSQLITELRIHAPKGVEVPRDPATNVIYEPTIERWAADAAQLINERRGKTTRLEVDITTEDGVHSYDLPETCRSVLKIDRLQYGGRNEILDIPVDRGSVLGLGMGGFLPSGQEITGALDVIARQSIVRQHREDEYELIGTATIRFLFPIDGEETIRVTYYALDRTLDSIPEDFFEHVLTYLRMKNLDRFIGREGSVIAMDEQRLVEGGMSVLIRQKAELQNAWLSALNSIQREAD